MSLRGRGLSLNCHLFCPSPLAGRTLSPPNGPQTPSVDSRTAFSTAARYYLLSTIHTPTLRSQPGGEAWASQELPLQPPE